MKRKGIPVSLESYVALAYMGDLRVEDLTAEQIADLPEELQAEANKQASTADVPPGGLL